MSDREGGRYQYLVSYTRLTDGTYRPGHSTVDLETPWAWDDTDEILEQIRPVTGGSAASIVITGVFPLHVQHEVEAPVAPARSDGTKLSDRLVAEFRAKAARR